MLTAVIHGVRQDDPSYSVQLAAAYALWREVRCFRLRNVHRLVCYRENATTSCTKQLKTLLIVVQVGAVKCFVQTAVLYQIASYMELDLSGLTVMGMNIVPNECLCKLSSLGRTVCEEGIKPLEVHGWDLLILLSGQGLAIGYGESPEGRRRPYNPHLSGKNADQCEWKIPISAGICGCSHDVELF
ncbi:hypothetical protein EDD15DRAFT_1519004 [Pisolithus albus]|nr:hypothetical protein EDD15DRAFT_1519004 [Pisolithus albus]